MSRSQIPTSVHDNPDAAFDVTALIVNYNTRDLLRPCIEALRASAVGLRLQIVIIDNASRDDSATLMRAEFLDCDLLFNSVNVGFGRANNQALALARGRLVLLLNTDAFVASDTLGQTVGYMDEHPACGLLGVRLIGRDGVLQPSCRYFPTPWNAFLVRTGLNRWFPKTPMVDDMNWDHAGQRACDWVPGCYYLVRRSVIDRVGLFDPRYFLYYEEVDHCRAVKAAGWQVMYYGGTTVVHIGGESAKSDAQITAGGRQISDLQVESGLLYHRKHHGIGGLLGVIAFGVIGDALLSVKCLLRGRGAGAARACWDNSITTWALVLKTRWGTQATR